MGGLQGKRRMVLDGGGKPRFPIRQWPFALQGHAEGWFAGQAQHAGQHAALRVLQVQIEVEAVF
ncbi:hypothetical protein D3C87_2150380 [compost metagenome]